MGSSDNDKDREELRQYLLGLLAESEREPVDRRILTDSEFYEELQATEDDLVDEYLSGKLTEQERRQFELHFASGEERHNKLQFGRSLQKHLRPQEERGKLAFVGFGERLNSRAMLVFAVCLIFVGIIAWFVIRQSGRQSRPQQTLAITLKSGAVRGIGQATSQLARPPANSLVNVHLQLTNKNHTSYNVDLSQENVVLKPFKDLHALGENGNFVVVVPVQSDLLDAGDYTFSLTGISDSNPPEPEGNYYLRVTR